MEAQRGRAKEFKEKAKAQEVADQVKENVKESRLDQLRLEVE